MRSPDFLEIPIWLGGILSKPTGELETFLASPFGSCEKG